MNNLERFKREAIAARERYVSALTDVAWQAMRDAGHYIEHGEQHYERLLDAVSESVQ